MVGIDNDTPRFITRAEAVVLANSIISTFELDPRGWASKVEHTSNQASRQMRYEVMRAQRLLAYARCACHWIFNDSSGHVLLCVTEHGIWEEHRPLESALRDQVSDAGTLEDKPGLVVGSSDRDFLTSYVFVALTFGWGLAMMNDIGSRWFECNHDGKVWVGSNVEADVEKAKSWLNWE